MRPKHELRHRIGWVGAAQWFAKLQPRSKEDLFSRSSRLSSDRASAGAQMGTTTKARVAIR